MATRGQTHNKRARELALKERRERKQAKKEDRRAGIYPSDVDDELTPADELESPEAGELESPETGEEPAQ